MAYQRGKQVTKHQIPVTEILAWQKLGASREHERIIKWLIGNKFLRLDMFGSWVMTDTNGEVRYVNDLVKDQNNVD